ncbi:hypothetical protein [Bradyrhizobium sp. Arg816]|uniref:hypothetical protein n=1 Tax=Bradyrhizobium sp. Arg816 TaxID=2998491 RepID=UPI00249EEDD9|nr:hypothetical protein [Bradyrhizobium sp. Arg816]MDI3562464.1 hypothetical protein [Bradyrhizobium sp. Arg816]
MSETTKEPLYGETNTGDASTLNDDEIEEMIRDLFDEHLSEELCRQASEWLNLRLDVYQACVELGLAPNAALKEGKRPVVAKKVARAKGARRQSRTAALARKKNRGGKGKSGGGGGG